MDIANNAISTKFLNIIIRTNHGQTEIVMQYGGLRSSVTCVTGGGSVMVWARICHDGRTLLKIVQGTLNVVIYRDDIL
jgi:hypothetical protein